MRHGSSVQLVDVCFQSLLASQVRSEGKPVEPGSAATKLINSTFQLLTETFGDAPLSSVWVQITRNHIFNFKKFPSFSLWDHNCAIDRSQESVELLIRSSNTHLCNQRPWPLGLTLCAIWLQFQFILIYVTNVFGHLSLHIENLLNCVTNAPDRLRLHNESQTV